MPAEGPPGPDAALSHHARVCSVANGRARASTYTQAMSAHDEPDPRCPAPRPPTVEVPEIWERGQGIRRRVTDSPPSEPSEAPPVILDRRSLQEARRKERKKQRRKWPRRILTVLGCVVIVVALVGVGGFVYAQYRFHEIKKVHAKHLVKAAPPGQPFNILIVGSDTRSFVTNATQEKAFGSASVKVVNEATSPSWPRWCQRPSRCTSSRFPGISG